MFAGIGSGIVALKRLGIKIQTIIHVEHDPVASHGMESSQLVFRLCQPKFALYVTHISLILLL